MISTIITPYYSRNGYFLIGYHCRHIPDALLLSRAGRPLSLLTVLGAVVAVRALVLSPPSRIETIHDLESPPSVGGLLLEGPLYF